MGNDQLSMIKLSKFQYFEIYCVIIILFPFSYLNLVL